MDLDQERVFNLLCMIPALVAGLTVHEFAHAWAADKLGDDTPRREGRLNLDPMSHIDPFGALFFIVASLSGYGIGWAKPVMTNPRNLKYPRRDSLLIAIAGPISNLLQVPFWLAAVFAYGYASRKFGWYLDTQPHSPQAMMGEVLRFGVLINISLAAFNMIPFPPLDGHWVLQSLGGKPIEMIFDEIRPYSFFILIFIINFTPALRYILEPVNTFASMTAFRAQLAGMTFGI